MNRAAVIAKRQEGTLSMTIEEIELACDASGSLELPRHEVEVPELTHREIYYPLGFQTVLTTNSTEILSLAHSLWSMFEQRFDRKPIVVDVHVVKGSSDECPPDPIFRLMHPHLTGVADRDNYSIVSLDEGRTQVVVSQSTLEHSAYLADGFLGNAPFCHIATRYTTPLHAACVALDGRGTLLCGDSGAGKSSLAYACARGGWTYVGDDSSFLLHDVEDRLVTSNCHRVRFRPAVRELFPEVKGRTTKVLATGKPTVELLSASIAGVTCAPTALVDFVVFLNRRVAGPPQLVPYRKEVARYSMRQVPFGSAESLAVHYAAIERLLTAEVFELRYSDLDWAVDRLETLTREGR
jgi:hypothetical protein